MKVMPSWESLLERNLTGNYQSRPYNLCLYWRALSYREHSGEPEPLVRAYAFQNVLDHLEIEVDAGLVLGNCRGFSSNNLPDGVTETGYQQLVQEHTSRGQRDFWAGFDHTLADYPTLLTIGIEGYRARVREALARYPNPEQVATLKAIDITLAAFTTFIHRVASIARQAGRTDCADACSAVAEKPPHHFRDALQLVWLTHLVFKSEGRSHMALGRIDQYLRPFYDRDLREGTTNQASALELLCHLWARIDEIGEVQNICIGGLTPQGEDATNELSYLCLEATRQVKSPHTNLSARFSDLTPNSFHRACFEVIRTGIGFPAIFNDHVLIPGLVEIGIPSEIARDYCMVGCIETMLPGRQQSWSDSRFNTPLYLLQALHTMASEAQPSYGRLLALFQQALSEGMQAHTAHINSYIARFPAEKYPDPFLSALTHDCITRGKDVNAGGAQFKRFHGVCVMGLATIADALAAVKKLVFDDGSISYCELVAALDSNFEGAESLRQMLAHKAPKYGNDDPYVDEIAAQVVQWTAQECLKYQVWGGGQFISAMAANTQNISAGLEVGATPDGRRAFTPLSDAASPYFGRDLNGPTAFLRSVAFPDYHQVLTGSVINMRFDPDHFTSEEGDSPVLIFHPLFCS